MDNLPAPILILILIIILLLLLLLLLFLAWRRKRGPFTPPFPREEFFITNHVILAGPASIIQTQVIDEVKSQGLVRLTPLDDMPFDRFGSDLVQCAGLPADYTIYLYQLDGRETTVEQAIGILNSLGAQLGLTVVAEPNRIVGSPWEPEPSPWEPEPSPVAGALPTVAKPEHFLEQWAFRLTGLSEVMGRRMEQGAGPDGAHVRVAVFDTAPYEDAAAYNVDVIQRVPTGRGDEFELKVRTAQTWIKRMPDSVRPPSKINSHGVFAAGLIQATAPKSDIRLVRVLEEGKRGDLYRLMKAIFDFMVEYAGEKNAGDSGSTGAVINLSLGVRVPPHGLFPNIEDDLVAFESLLDIAECLNVVVVAAAGNDSYKSLSSLPAHFPARREKILGVASCTVDQDRSCFSNQGDIAAPGGAGDRGIITYSGEFQRLFRSPRIERIRPVTVGGNDEKRPDGPTPLDLDALRLRRNEAIACVPKTNECAGPDCPYGVIGPVYDETTKNHQFVYWAGTSFSTPQVSGLAALLLQCLAGLPDTGQSKAEIVRTLIFNSATVPPQRSQARQQDDGLGRGIICIPQALKLCQSYQYDKGQAQVKPRDQSAA